MPFGQFQSGICLTNSQVKRNGKMSFGFVSFQTKKINAIITSKLSICFAQFTVFFLSIKLNMNQLNSSCMQSHSFKVEDLEPKL